MKNSSIIVAMLFASSSAIKIKHNNNEAAINTCVNVRKDSGIEEPCNTGGNSAWDEDVPV
mgnify:CR=1 FL=1